MLLQGQNMALFGPARIVALPLLKLIPISNTNLTRWLIMILVINLLVPLKIPTIELEAIRFAVSKINFEEGFSRM